MFRHHQLDVVVCLFGEGTIVGTPGHEFLLRFGVCGILYRKTIFIREYSIHPNVEERIEVASDWSERRRCHWNLVDPGSLVHKLHAKRYFVLGALFRVIHFLNQRHKAWDRGL